MHEPGAPARWSRPRRIWLLFVVAVGAAAAMASPYLLLDIASSRITPIGTTHYVLLVVHIFTATIALVLGPLQFVPAVRADGRRHRWIGRTYLLLGVGPSGVTGIPVALLSDQPLSRVGLLIPAVGWLITAGLAVRAIRRGDVEAHRSWMTRNYALTFLAVTARVLAPLGLLGRLAITGASAATVTADIPAAVSYGQVAAWVLNLVIAEVMIRRRRSRRPPRRAWPPGPRAGRGWSPVAGPGREPRRTG